LATIPGMVPDLRDLPKGCRFRSRCDKAQDKCAEREPELTELGPRRVVRCFFPNNQD
jgi:peptide/nickel transport system ATP-binding protein